MKLDGIACAMLRGALMALLASAGVSLVAISASRHFWSSMHEAYEAETTRLRAIAEHHRLADEQRRLVETYLPRYRALEARGIIGPEHRLDWVESLRAVSRGLNVPSVRYAITRQKSYSPRHAITAGAFRVYGSAMQLDLGLLHEEDLPRLLSGLDERVRGLYSVEWCDLRRSRDVFVAEPGEPNLTVRCELLWTTVRRPEGPGDPP